MWQLATALTVVLAVAYLMWPRAEITSEPAVVATAPSRMTPAAPADNTAVVPSQPSEDVPAPKTGPEVEPLARALGALGRFPEAFGRLREAMGEGATSGGR